MESPHTHLSPLVKRFFSLKTASEKRLLVLLVAIVCGWAYLQYYQHWSPSHVETTEHYRIESSESPENTQAAGKICERLYETYASTLAPAVNMQPIRRPMKMRLYSERDEFKRCNVLVRGYAEAVYRNKTCHQYYDTKADNPYHWMLHEATHQLNHEVAKLNLKLWLDEGLACYFSTNAIVDQKFQLGTPDYKTYPMWWLSFVNLTGDWQKDVATGKIIPLETLIQSGAPNPGEDVNNYYLHWWSWTHFLLQGEEGKYREPYLQLLTKGGSIGDFEETIGNISAIERQWYLHYQKQTQKARQHQLAAIQSAGKRE